MRKLVPGLLGVILMSGCGSVTENVVERAAERAAEASGGSGDVDIDLEDGSVSAQVETPEGSQNLQIGNAEVSDGFPIPIADGGTVVSAITQENGGETSYGVSVQFPADRYDDVVAFYDDWMAGLEGETQKSTSSGGIDSTQWTNLDAEVVVLVSRLDEMVNVNLSSGF